MRVIILALAVLLTACPDSEPPTGELVVTPADLALDPVVPGDASEAVVVLSNPGGAALDVAAPLSGGDAGPFSLTGVQWPLALPAGGSVTFTARFEPGDVGDFESTWSFVGTPPSIVTGGGPSAAAPVEPVSVVLTLSGQGLDPALPDGDGDGYRVDVDCNDENPSIHPGAPESCDDVDSDCDGSLVDEDIDTDGDDEPDCTDPDDDGDGDPDATDCAELDDAIYTGAPEACDAVDSDCDGSLVDEDVDTDGDGVPDCADEDVDGDGFSPADGDCNDENPSIHPGAPESCDDVDSDCDGSLVDEDIDTDGDDDPDCTDPDDDGDGDPDATDCAELDDAIYTGAPEACDAVDSDCDGSLVDEDPDTDGDDDPDCTDPDDDGDGDPDATDCADEDVDGDGVSPRRRGLRRRGSRCVPRRPRAV